MLKLALAGVSLAASIMLAPTVASAQSQYDSFVAAQKLSPANVTQFTNGTAFYASVTSHGGKYGLNNSTRVRASKIAVVDGANQRVPDGIVSLPVIQFPFKSYELDFIGSQVSSSVNRIYLKQLALPLPECQPCFEIHRTIEMTKSITGDWDWVLGTVGATGPDGQPWQGVYFDGGKEDGAGTKFLAPGTPVWQRQSGGDTAGIGSAFHDIFPRLVLRPTSPGTPASTDWQIAELGAGDTWTGQLLGMSAQSNEVFSMINVLQDSDWRRYFLQPATNANPSYTNFEIRVPVGVVASTAILPEGKTSFDRSLFNLDTFLTVKKSEAFAGMAGVAFNLSAKPLLSLNQDFTYPGFIALATGLPERLAMTLPNGNVLYFPQDYNGMFPGVVFGIRGASGSCTQRGMIDYPVSGGISEFPGRPEDKTGAWMVCVLPWAWQVDQPYQIRLWTIGENPTKQRTWGAWISKADGSDARQIGALTIDEDKYGNDVPQVVSAGTFVRISTPQACDKVGALEITIDKVVANAGVKKMAATNPWKSSCSGLNNVATCSGGSCTIGIQ